MDLTIKASIPQLIERRRKALRELEDAVDLIQDALKLADDACVGDGNASYELKSVVVDEIKYKGRDFKEKLRVAMDRSMWRSFVVNTPLWGLMDTKARKKFDEDMAGVPPEATLENLSATMSMYFADADKIFVRSLIETFRSLPNKYKSNHPFKLDKKIILGSIQDRDGYFSSYAGDRIRDLDRVFWVLDGLDYNASYDSGLRGAITHAMAEKRKEAKTWGAVSGEVQTEYFTVKFFKNGNAHAVFMRPDLVQKANRLIAEYYGATLPGDTGRTSYQSDADETRDLNYFPTPDDIVQKMIDEADLEDGMNVLEPSAGSGSIVKALRDCGVSLDIRGYEIDSQRAKQAEVKHFDFMQVSPAADYDRILMNPPFSHGRWARHILHASDFLKPDGALFAIVPTGNVPSSLNAEWNRKISHRCRVVATFPPGAFKESGTMIATKLIEVFGE